MRQFMEPPSKSNKVEKSYDCFKTGGLSCRPLSFEEKDGFMKEFAFEQFSKGVNVRETARFFLNWGYPYMTATEETVDEYTWIMQQYKRKYDQCTRLKENDEVLLHFQMPFGFVKKSV